MRLLRSGKCREQETSGCPRGLGRRKLPEKTFAFHLPPKLFIAGFASNLFHPAIKLLVRHAGRNRCFGWLAPLKILPSA